MSGAPLFRRRPPDRGYGYDAAGRAGWLFTAGFVAVAGTTAILGGRELERGEMLAGAAGMAAFLLQVAAFLWIARRDAQRT